jgi:hypothetical protein
MVYDVFFFSPTAAAEMQRAQEKEVTWAELRGTLKRIGEIGGVLVNAP